MKQIEVLHKPYDQLQQKYGEPFLNSIYGAGCVDNPKIMFIFMNPTGRNIASEPSWQGLRAPWIGTKPVWDIFNELNIISEDTYEIIRGYKPKDWDVEFSSRVYSEIEANSVFITNLAKCTQLDARPLNNSIFKDYMELMLQEIELVNPQKIVSFGNQVSSILLGKNISVSNYLGDEVEDLSGYEVYPTYYPVGQGRRNMPLALKRIQSILQT